MSPNAAFYRDNLRAADALLTGQQIVIPDGSSVWALAVRAHGEAPAGLDVMSNNPFMAEDENTSVIAYRDEDGISCATSGPTATVRGLSLQGPSPDLYYALRHCQLKIRGRSPAGTVPEGLTSGMLGEPSRSGGSY